ncbi:Actin-related protein 2/3 complex subunit 5 [Lamellibrachia satsuma]|nr:Actin-related protein 2/3 complex subunit 5 [Lamellibrachia satsuma]
MSKNTRDTLFRKVDVDQYAEDKFEEEEQGDGSVNGVGPNEAEVQTLLSQGRNVDALKVSLRNPPVTSKNQAVKDKSLQVVMRVIMSIKSSDIDNAVKSLDSPTKDILMKYIYRGFEIPAEGSSAQLLTWHQKVFASAGLGCIVRVLTDRKRV